MSDQVYGAAPALAVMTVPPHKERWDRVGRLYHEPGFVLPENFRDPLTLAELVKNGDLMPSITNVIGAKASPWLIAWAARLAAETAMQWSMKHQDAWYSRPQAAISKLKNLHFEKRDAAAVRGSKVHAAMELLFQNQSIDHLMARPDYDDSVKACIYSGQRFLDTYTPEVRFVEVTGFGKTPTNRKFAGTADFHITINGVNILGDVKCTTDTTLILMADGSQKQAVDIEVGDLVVAWNEKDGMSPAKITHAGSNGIQKTVTVRDSLGQEVTTTLNHPFLSHTDKGMTWVNAEDLKRGDAIYSGHGWVHSGDRTYQESSEAWPYNKHLSPYLYGLLWGLAQHNEVPWEENTRAVAPGGAREELYEVLASHGFIQSKDGFLLVKNGLKRVAKKAKLTVDELLERLNSPSIPGEIFRSERYTQEAFVYGIQEAFLNRERSTTYYVPFRDVAAARSLQQLYLNNNLPAVIGRSNLNAAYVVRSQATALDHVHTYGLEEVEVTYVEFNEEPEHTVALTVEGSHTHFTNGILTHNTNASGLNDDVALQLAANRNVDTITTDNVTLQPAPQTDMTAALWLGEDGYQFREVTSDQPVMDVFNALRETWEFAAFPKQFNALKPVFRGPADVGAV